MLPSTILFQRVIVIYTIIVIISAKSHKNDSSTIAGSNISNKNNIFEHYNDTSNSIPMYAATRSLINKSEPVFTQKREANGIQKRKEYVIAYKDSHDAPSNVAFQNEQKSAAMLAVPQNTFYVFNQGGHSDKNEKPANSKTQETTAVLPTKVTAAQQPVLVKILVDKMKLTAEHRLASNCKKTLNRAEVPPVIKLLNYIAKRYLFHCISLILYDDFYEQQYHLLRALLSTYPLTYIHGKVSKQELMDPPDMRCRDFLLFVRDLKTAEAVVGNHCISRVIVVSQASTWRIREFLSSKLSRNLVNLLVIGNQNQSDSVTRHNVDINLYTHDLFIDGLGSSSLRILTAWRCGALTRPKINLFPDKMHTGFMGHQFVVAAGHQPPFIVKRGMTPCHWVTGCRPFEEDVENRLPSDTASCSRRQES